MHEFVGDFGGAHLGLQVVSGDTGRRDEDAEFARERRLLSPIEKEGDVRVFFRLRDAKLLQARLGNYLAEKVGQLLRRQDDGKIVILAVARHGDEVRDLDGRFEAVEAAAW